MESLSFEMRPIVSMFLKSLLKWGQTLLLLLLLFQFLGSYLWIKIQILKTRKLLNLWIKSKPSLHWTLSYIFIFFTFYFLFQVSAYLFLSHSGTTIIYWNTTFLHIMSNVMYANVFFLYTGRTIFDNSIIEADKILRLLT